MVNQSTVNDTASLAESTSTCSNVTTTPSELHSAAPEVIDVDVDENDVAPPAAEQDDEADLNALKKTWCSAVYSFLKLDAVTVQYHDGRLVHFFPCGAHKCKLFLVCVPAGKCNTVGKLIYRGLVRVIPYPYPYGYGVDGYGYGVNLPTRGYTRAIPYEDPRDNEDKVVVDGEKKSTRQLAAGRFDSAGAWYGDKSRVRDKIN